MSGKCSDVLALDIIRTRPRMVFHLVSLADVRMASATAAVHFSTRNLQKRRDSQGFSW